MPLSPEQVNSLVRGLTARGWVIEDGFIYAPNRTIWLLVEHPWVGDLADFVDRMQGRLQRISGNQWMYEDTGAHAGVCSDTASLVEVLEEMTKARNER